MVRLKNLVAKLNPTKNYKEFKEATEDLSRIQRKIEVYKRSALAKRLTKANTVRRALKLYLDDIA